MTGRSRWLLLLALMMIAIGALALMAGSSEARTCTWDSEGVDNRSSTMANWDLDTAPIAGDDVIISSTNDAITWDIATNSMGSITLTSGFTGSFTVGSNLYFTDFSQSIGSTLTGSTSYMAYCSGNFTSSIGSGFTLDVLKLTMAGDNNIIILPSNAVRLHTLIIDGNITASTGIGLSNTLIINADASLSINTGLTVFGNYLSTYTNNGEIKGLGEYEHRFYSASPTMIFGTISSNLHLWLYNSAAANRIVTLGASLNVGRTLYVDSGHASNTITLDAAGYDLGANQIVVGIRGVISCGEGAIYTTTLTSTLGTVTPETATWHVSNNSLITMAAGGELYDVEVNGTALRLGSDVTMNSLTFLGLTPSHPYGWWENTVRDSSVASDANGSYALGGATFAWDSATLQITPVVTVYDNYEWTHDDGTSATDTYVDYHYWLMFVNDYDGGTAWGLTGADWLSLYEDGMIAGRSSIPGNFTYNITATAGNGEIGTYSGYIIVHEFLPDPDWPDNPGSGVIIETPVLFILGDVEITLWDMYDPYYIEVTNDTLNIATVAGEFPMTYWSNGAVDVNVTTFKPYTNTFFAASLTSGGDDLDLRFGGFQPGATFTVVIGGVSSTKTADGAGYLIINIENIISTTLSITYLHTPPVFTTSPDIVANELVWYVYDADVYPSDAVVTIEEKPYWLYWDEESYSLIGYPRDLGTFEVRLKAVNSYGTSWQNWTIYIYSHEIGFTSNPDLTIDKFDYYEYEVDYYPPSAVCKVLLIPTWLHFNEYTDTLKGTALKAGSYNVVIRVTLGHAVAYQNFTITVNDVDDPSWLDHDMSIDLGMLMLYILIGGGVVFMMIVFYLKRM